MVKISKEGDKVIISCLKNDDFLKNRNNRTTLLDIFEFKEKKKNREFVIEVEEPDEIIDELKQEFEEIKLEFNDAIKKTFERKRITQNEFNDYKRMGNKLKHKANNRPKLVYHPSIIKPGQYPPLQGIKKGFKLRPYQGTPVKHLELIPNTANFSIPGSGKTVMTYAGFYILKKQKKADQLFVICPKPAFGPWKTEFQMFMPGFSNKSGDEVADKKRLGKYLMQYHASTVKDSSLTNAQKRASLRKHFEEKEVILTTYDTAAVDLGHLGKYFQDTEKKVLLVLDESHKIKTIRERTKKGNLTMAEAMIKLGKNVARRCILTGTPVPHEYDDIWSQITFLWPDVEPLGKRGSFTSLIEGGNPGRQIKNRIDFTWTRIGNKQMEKDLPKKRFHVKDSPHGIEMEVVMDYRQAEIYRLIRSKLMKGVPPGRTQKWIKNKRRARTIRLLQAVTNPKLLVEKDPIYSSLAPPVTGTSRENVKILKLVQEYHRSAVPNKIKSVAELARILCEQGKSVVIFTHFVGNVNLLAKLLKDKKPLWITGKIRKHSEQEDIINAFKDWRFDNNEGKILIATAGTVAESVSLHKNKEGKPVCNNAIFLERSYDAGKYMQALHRIYRIGSIKSNPVHYYIFRSKLSKGEDTIDKTINEILEKRIKKLYELLDDRYILKFVSLDTKVIKKQEQFYGANDDEEDIVKKIEDEERKNMQNAKP